MEDMNDRCLTQVVRNAIFAFSPFGQSLRLPVSQQTTRLSNESLMIVIYVNENKPKRNIYARKW